MFYIIVLIILAVIVYFYIKKKKTKPQDTPKTNEPNSIDILLDINILIRLNFQNEEITTKVEVIIDKLRNIIPILNKEYKSSELNWVVNKMASKYLPNVLYPYSKLSEEQQIVKEDALLESLNSIHTELDEIISMLNKKDESKFDSKAKFINHRFSDKF